MAVGSFTATESSVANLGLLQAGKEICLRSEGPCCYSDDLNLRTGIRGSAEKLSYPAEWRGEGRDARKGEGEWERLGASLEPWILETEFAGFALYPYNLYHVYPFNKPAYMDRYNVILYGNRFAEYCFASKPTAQSSKEDA